MKDIKSKNLKVIFELLFVEQEFLGSHAIY